MTCIWISSLREEPVGKHHRQLWKYHLRVIKYGLKRQRKGDIYREREMVSLITGKINFNKDSVYFDQ